MTLRVPLEALPLELHARHGRLRDYFCDKDAEASLDGSGWRLELAWPNAPERHVDTRIQEVLADWGRISLSSMAMARCRSGRVLTALYDTWTLPSWSEWADRAKPAANDPITILHIDDHRDLGSPRLVVDDDGFRDLITGRLFDVRDPSSVRSACESGAVGMGSFMTPFLWEFASCDVRHLGQAPKISETVDHAIERPTVVDDLLAPGSERPAINLLQASSPGPGRFRATDDLSAWLEDIGPGPILLHVDMDYFNNRYDGDGDWPDRFPRLDPPITEVLARIDAVAAALRQAGVVDRIVDAVVAYSPGFFPAEMWRPADARLRSALPELYE
ncbi:hypothetical protein [Sphingomonas sp. HMP6]|uniref:hypothetical protein n=1 Tax=Sphingomonas sp. HMP6 TaxID=1517551 RepID=UPI0015967428|nr:hypothetical protein [Sphingomonas sp. HMP6]BCA58138.1 hypothetical protein HMP06_0907 [Sphingomonas sp. HMP6]